MMDMHSNVRRLAVALLLSGSCAKQIRLVEVGADRPSPSGIRYCDVGDHWLDGEKKIAEWIATRFGPGVTASRVDAASAWELVREASVDRIVLNYKVGKSSGYVVEREPSGFRIFCIQIDEDRSVVTMKPIYVGGAVE